MAFTTWNPADKAGTLALSNGDLTVISTSTVAGGIRSVLSIDKGKYYWEITVVTRSSDQHYSGIGDSAALLTAHLGYATKGYCYTGWGEKMHNNVSSSYGDAYYAGDILSVALDLDAGKIWWAKNGVWQASGDPAAGTGEAFSGISGIFYAMNSIWKLNDSFTANFGASAFTYSVPSGFYSGFEDLSTGTKTFYPAVSSDDGVRSGDTGFVTDATSMLIGKDGDVPQYNFIRFTDVAIPQGSRIIKAQLKATAASTISTTPLALNFKFVDEDNPNAPTTYQEFDAMPLAQGAGVGNVNSEGMIDGNEYEIPSDFTSALQPIMERSGFNAGNAVILKIEAASTASFDVKRSISTIDYNSGSEKPGLYVEWAGEDSAGEWEEVAPQLGAETYIYGLTEFNGKLYGCTGDNGRLYEWNGSDAWAEVALQLGSETVINCLVEFNGKLYGGTGPNAKLYEWNDVDAWVEVAPQVSSEYQIQSLVVFQGKLYGGTVRTGLLVEWNGVDAWTVVAFHDDEKDEKGIYSLTVFNNDLYGGTGDGTPPDGGALLFKWNEVDAWEKVAYRNPPDNRIVALVVFNNKIYGAGWDSGRLLEWNSAGSGTWVEVAPQLGSEKVASLLVFNDKLYGGTRESGKLYIWNNVDAWAIVAPQLEETRILSLAEFGGRLYGGTGITGKLYTWGEIVIGNISVSSPMMQVEGHTGIYEVNVSLPMMQAEGHTGIAGAVTLPMMQAAIHQGITASNVIPMCQAEGFTGIFSGVSIPMPVAVVTGHDNIEHSNIAVTNPSMTASLAQALHIEANIAISSMTVSITERENSVASVSIPMMTVVLSSGLKINASCTVPMMTSAGLFSSQCEATIPMMAVEMEGTVGEVIHSDIKLPMMAVEMEGRTEHLINCDVSVPIMRAAAELITGKLITGAVTLPMMEAALISYEEIIGDIDASIPMMEAYMIGTTERAVCTVLRYNDLPDCIGDIVVDIPMTEASLMEL